MFSVQPQRNNDRGETSESAGQNKSQRQTIGSDPRNPDFKVVSIFDAQYLSNGRPRR